jgi:hypothetical protein
MLFDLLATVAFNSVISAMVLLLCYLLSIFCGCWLSGVELGGCCLCGGLGLGLGSGLGIGNWDMEPGTWNKEA